MAIWGDGSFLRTTQPTTLLDASTGLGASVAAIGDSSAGGNQLKAWAFLAGFNGTTTDRLRIASAANASAQPARGVLVAGLPGTWSAFSAPAVSTQATASRAAGAAGVRHICTAISFGFSAAVAIVAATLIINLRDGATGAGTVLQSWQFSLPAAIVAPFALTFSGLSIFGTAATAMTLEFSALLTNLLEFTNISGYDVQ